MEIVTALHKLRTYPTMRKLAEVLYGAAVLLATALLFQIDIAQPRGVVDGVGYSAIVALTSRFGPRAVLSAAIVTSGLTLLGAYLVPPFGISVVGMWANRLFALAAVWVVALVMRRRMELENRILERESNIRRHEEAIATIIRTGVLVDMEFSDRLRVVCQTGAEALGGVLGIVGLRNDDNQTLTVLQSWRRPPGPLLRPPGSTMGVDKHHRAKLAQDFFVAIEDIENSQLEPHTLKAVRAHGVRSMLSAEIIHGSERSGTIVFGREGPHRWTEEEIAFARATAQLVGLLVSTENNAETLAALELTDDGIYTEDAAGKVQYSNRAARLFGRKADDRHEFPKPKLALAAGHDRHEIHFEGRDLEIHRARLPTGGLIARLEDVTERNRIAEEKLQLEDRLQQSAKMEAIGQLASGMAHDFNNILGAITGFAGFISQDSATDSQNRDFAQRILSASRRGKEMVEQIMAFAEARAVSHGITNIGRTLQRCEELLQTSMHPGAMLELDLPETLLLVRGNEVQIGQLVTNLATNARDALHGGGGVVEIGASLAPAEEIARLRDFSNTPQERLIGELQPDIAAYARLWVRDSGNGIPPDILDRIFEPFFTTKGRQRGTGLGLAVVHGVVRAHNGFCHIRTEIGRGTVFEVFLPLVGDLVEATTVPAESVGQPCRVLIVDDEADMADMLSIALERLGHHTVAVQNPITALAAIEEDPTAFDALLTDQLMPAMRGTELIREAKRVAPGLRAVLCTGNAESMSESEARAMGADAVLYKPVDIQAVSRAVSGVAPT